jgi:outer membrane protein TolC
MKASSARLALLVVAAWLFPTNAGWARTLDRRTAIRAALAQNPQVAAARAEEAAAEAQTRQVRAAHMPIVTLDAGIGPSFVATLVPGTAVESREAQYRNLKAGDLSAVFLGNLTIVQPLYTFGKIALRGEAAAHAVQARQAQTRMQRADVAFAVAQIYEGYLLARDSERFLDEMAHWLNRSIESTEERLANGAPNVTDRDLLRLQTAAGMAAMGLNQARAGMAQAQAGLVAYLGLPAHETITVVEDELLPVGRLTLAPNVLVRLAGDHRPEFVALREGESAFAALGRAEAAGLWPNIFVMGLLSAAYTPGRDWIQTRFVVDPLNHFVPGALLGLRWELQGSMAAARADEQRARRDGAAHMRRWAAAGIPAEVHKAYQDVVRAESDIEHGKAALKKAKQWMVQSSADFTAGFLEARELSDAVAAYVSLRTGVMKATFDHNLAMASLSKATGTLDNDSGLFYLAATPSERTLETP